MFLRNPWYAATWDHEVNRTPLGRTVRSELIVFYRQVTGALSAFEDCCPGRMSRILRPADILAKHSGCYITFSHSGLNLKMARVHGA
jgi:hypothetical protein